MKPDDEFAWVNGFLNRKVHNILTREILEDTSDADLEQTVIDNIMSKFDKDFSNEFEIVEGLSKGQQTIYSTWCLEAEVNNGGFDQYFFNSTGENAFMALEGLETLGLTNYYGILQSAIAMLDLKVDEFVELRRKSSLQAYLQAKELIDFSALDEEFYKLQITSGISGVRVLFIRENLNDFTD